jgi:hypothetical protein
MALGAPLTFTLIRLFFRCTRKTPSIWFKRGQIFQKLHAIGEDIIQFIPFVCPFYAFESPLFYNHRSHEGDVTIIPFAMGTHIQGDPLGRALFVLAHFKVLCSIASHFPSCLFLSIVNDIHITGPYLIISSAYEHFQTELHAIGDPPPNSLKNSNANPKMKTLEEEGIGACSLARSIFGVRGVC